MFLSSLHIKYNIAESTWKTLLECCSTGGMNAGVTESVCYLRELTMMYWVISEWPE